MMTIKLKPKIRYRYDDPIKIVDNFLVQSGLNTVFPWRHPADRRPSIQSINALIKMLDQAEAILAEKGDR
ncbi:hypothetical protein SK355_05915 [Candidatus Fukatsuia symbiotica]|uniref:Uncharacterized protein n=1 Tax=Candidatus Fukatsuia symbiotica TaxID=1878942 RepID=A0A2U8I5T9_9GAMM|nr:hypothetical protein [Candidatus Fukatsuia symbiotica]AWK14526.1 hypothetical protein CCS41_08635 [Candidatus Fukatsuia symbiotica]MEA9444818.1 hypothetical protein [Candidatus Fukatsuia symbiotica]